MNRAKFAQRATRLMCVTLCLALITLTLVERDFLDRVGWSPIGRSETQWPSLLALGPGGWLMTSTFAVAAVASAVIAACLWSLALGSRDLVGAASFMCVSIGFIGVCFPATIPGEELTMSSQIHNSTYPLILVGFLVATFVFGGAPTNIGRRIVVPASRQIGLLTGLFLIGTFIDDVAQLCRYFAFASMLFWMWRFGLAADHSTARAGA